MRILALLHGQVLFYFLNVRYYGAHVVAFHYTLILPFPDE